MMMRSGGGGGMRVHSHYFTLLSVVSASAFGCSVQERRQRVSCLLRDEEETRTRDMITTDPPLPFLLSRLSLSRRSSSPSSVVQPRLLPAATHEIQRCSATQTQCSLLSLPSLLLVLSSPSIYFVRFPRSFPLFHWNE